MKSKIILFLSIFLIAIVFNILSFVFFGYRSLFFKISLLGILSLFISTIFYFNKYLSQKFKRGKGSRLKYFEALSFLFIGISLIALVKSFDFNIDWTSRKLFHLSKETKLLVHNLNKELSIFIFSYEDKKNPGAISYAKTLAERYRSINPRKIRIKYIDPIRDKIKADEYSIQQNGTLIFEMNGKREYISADLLAENIIGEELIFKGETIFSAVIEKLLKEKETIIYYLTGHGETDFSSTGMTGFNNIKTMLLDRRYIFKPLNLDHHLSVPEDTDILIISDPKMHLSAQIYNSIEKYLDKNGSILYIVGNKTISDINLLLIKSGFVFLPNIAVDPSRTSKNQGEFSIIPILSPKSEITKFLQRSSAIIFPSASVISSITEEYTDENFIYDLSPLAKISQHGFAKIIFSDNEKSKEDTIIKDIQNLAISSIIASKENPEKQRRSVIIGSINFVDNSRISLGGNSTFFLNSIDFLLKKDLKMTIPPKNQDLKISVPQPKERRIIVIIVLIWNLFLICITMINLIKRSQKVKT